MISDPVPSADDPYDLQRFVAAQGRCYDQARAELRAGHKRTHWMWFVFPQLDGLGRSLTARRYAIRSLDEARAYLQHPLLGPRLGECTAIVNGLQGVSARQVFGTPDDLKLRSSMTLFDLVAPSGFDFAAVLDKYFGGQRDERTLALLGR
jgi:uncharacterized protein (DUF1810 family)